MSDALDLFKFEKVEFLEAFYDDWSGEVFYSFRTIPEIGHGEWAISSGGDTAYDLLYDRITQTEFPEELLLLCDYIPDLSDDEIEGLEE
jgi:hypothetical protein